MSIFSNKKNRNAFLPMSTRPTYRSSSTEPIRTFNHGFNNNLASPFPFQRTNKQQEQYFTPPTTIIEKSQKIAIHSTNATTKISLPVLDGNINWRNTCKSDCSPIEVIESIKNYCLNQSILDFDIDCEKFQIDGRFFSSNHEMAEFLIKMFNVKEETSTFIQIIRMNGSNCAYQNFYMDLISNLTQNGIISFSTFPKQRNSLLNFSVPDFDLDLDLDLESEYEYETDFIEIIDTIENGYHDEKQTAVRELAEKSSQLAVMKILLEIPNITERLLSICFQSIDVLLVRCILIVLMNGLIQNIQQEKIKEFMSLKTRWSTTQKLFNLQVEVRKSNEITQKIDQLLNVSA